MNDYLKRVYHFKGSPREIGYAAGQTFASRLAGTISRYIASVQDMKDIQKLHAGALPWLRTLPMRFQEEFEGMAEGAGIPLQRLAEWAFIEECDLKQCSAAVYLFEDRAWVARNNDCYAPELWGYVIIREVEGRIPTMIFSGEGDVFSGTGVNQEKLWLHYNFLVPWDEPSPNKVHVPAFVLMTEALELCRTIEDVEALLNTTDRDGGMLLFAVDGKTNQVALFESLCSQYFRREPSDAWIVGTNHYTACDDLKLTDANREPLGSLSRFAKMANLSQALCSSPATPNLPYDLIEILADDEIERRGSPLITVYANVACPSTGEIWYTFGGYPAASQGNWQRLPWPWRD
jgi:hypothetical protein